MRKIALISTLAAGFSFAHHSAASLGSVGLEGPGAPLESSSSATLPEGLWLLYLKLDHVRWKKYSFSDFPDQKDKYDFWIYGVGYGLKPWLSLYLFAPYYVKRGIKTTYSNSYLYTNSGFADISLMAALGFKYDRGFKLIPRQQSLDDLMDWHFTLYSGVSLPTGNPNEYDRARDPRGEFEPDMSTGFGKPSITIGFTATKQLISLPRLTFILDTNFKKFFEHTYNYVEEDKRKKYKFGDEFRLNGALVYRLYEKVDRRLRIDTILEANFQRNERDKEDGVKQSASGGNILYGTGGARLYYKNISLGMGLKVPLWKKLNEEREQQGGEGKEEYRLIFTLSTLF
ncbi:MAG: transporter [Aquificaceae bacterium]